MCRILQGVYFQNKSLQIRYFSTDEKKGTSKACAWLGTCPQWPEQLSQQEWPLFSWAWRQLLRTQDSPVSQSYALGRLCLATFPVLLGHLCILTSCPAHTLDPPGEASPDIHWQPAWHDWRDVPHKARFWLASFWALLFPTNISYKKALRQESHLFFRTYESEE